MTTYFRNLLLTSETANGATPPPFDPFADVVIPQQADWTDHGTMLTQSPGQWDARFEGMISPCSIVKIGNTYHLYYIGADGNRGDGGPANRKLGVATATDPLATWTKFAGNPILTYEQGVTDCDECGIFSAAAFWHNNEVVMYFGAMTEHTQGLVDGKINLATSSDGFVFTDQGTIWDINDSGASNGDEIFPTGAFENNGTFYVYFLEASGDWHLWLAEGPAKDTITSDQELDSSRRHADTSDPIRKNITDIIVPVTATRTTWNTEMQTANVNTPQTLTNQETYAFGATNHQHRVVYLDRAIATWLFVYYDPANFDFRIKTAPMVLV